MKKTCLLVSFFALLSAGSLFAQETAKPALAPVLSAYYNVRDALVAGDANTAATKAGEMLQAITGADTKTLTPKEVKVFTPLQNKLAFDARHISEKKDIDHQREHFATLSANMSVLAKSVHLSDQVIYKDYCPMQKAWWLTSETAIKNPYYGDAMLTCGSTKETIKP